MSRGSWGVYVVATLLGLAAVSPPALVAQGGARVAVGDLGYVAGSAEAVVQVVEFSDPACPQCALFHAASRDSLHRDFVDTGLVRWVTVPFQSGISDQGDDAVALVECAVGVGRGPEAMAELYRRQPVWVQGPKERAEELFRAVGAEVGLAADDLDRCMASPETRERGARAVALATECGVRGTPTYMVAGYAVMGALPYGYVRRIFEQRVTAGGAAVVGFGPARPECFEGG